MANDDQGKAVGRSVSFRPISLYNRAEEYGKTFKPERNPSAIICEALTEYLERRGVSVTAHDERAELMAAAEEMGLARAMSVLTRAARRRA